MLGKRQKRQWVACLGLSVCLCSGSVSAQRPAEPKDGRTFVSQPARGVAKYVGLLYFEDLRPVKERGKAQTAKVRIGTAFLVSDKHIVTAAHCIAQNPKHQEASGGLAYPPGEPFRQAGFASNIYFAPGHNGEIETPLDSKTAPKAVQPFGVYKVVGINQIYRAYFDSTEDPEIYMHDLVVLELDRSTAPLVGGHFRLDTSDLDLSGTSGPATELHVNGYDGDLATGKTAPDGGERTGHWQLTRKGTAPVDLENARRSRFHMIRLDCKVAGGASGGPVWMMDDDGPVAVGIAIHNTGPKSECVGLIFQQHHIDFIKEGLQP